MRAFVVYFDEQYTGVGQRSTEQRRVDSVFESAEAACARVRELEKMDHIVHVDFDVFEIEKHPRVG